MAFLRNIGEQSGFLYPEVAAQVLACYPEQMDVNSQSRNQSWVLNHFVSHNSLHCGVNRFASSQRRKLFDEKVVLLPRLGSGILNHCYV